MSLGGCGVTDNEVGLGFGGALGSGGSFWDSEVSAFGSTDSGVIAKGLCAFCVKVKKNASLKILDLGGEWILSGKCEPSGIHGLYE